MSRAAVLFVLLAAGRVAARYAVGSAMSGTDVYYSSNSGDLSVVAERVSWAGSGSLLRSAAALSVAACAQACRADLACSWYNYLSCDPQITLQGGSCNSSEVPGDRPSCLLFNSGCTLTPLVGMLQNGGSVLRTAGFPIRFELHSTPHFEALSAQGVTGADLACPDQTVLPGQCALRSLPDAMRLCLGLGAVCQAIVQYRNGTDGCSESLNVLVTCGLTPLASFVSPSVATISRTDGSQRSSMLMATEGSVVEPSTAEVAAAAASPTPATAWLGCIVANSTIMAGALVGVQEGVASAEACCRACRADSRCDTWNWCSQAGGCSYVREPRILNLEQGQCELRHNDIAGPSEGFPPNVIAKGEGVGFVGGAPLSTYTPPLPGFNRLPGRTQFEVGRYSCSNTLTPELEECSVGGHPPGGGAALPGQPGVRRGADQARLAGAAARPGGGRVQAAGQLERHGAQPFRHLLRPPNPSRRRQRRWG